MHTEIPDFLAVAKQEFYLETSRRAFDQPIENVSGSGVSGIHVSRYGSRGYPGEAADLELVTALELPGVSGELEPKLEFEAPRMEQKPLPLRLEMSILRSKHHMIAAVVAGCGDHCLPEYVADPGEMRTISGMPARQIDHEHTPRH